MNSTATMSSAATMNSTASGLPPEASARVYRYVVSGLTITGMVYLLLAFPFGAILLKYRVNYVPRQAPTDRDGDEKGTQPHSTHPVKSYFSMFHRVLRLENWNGLYKGLMPSLIKEVFTACILLLSTLNRDRDDLFPERSIWYKLTFSFIWMVFSLPAKIIINRAITTPHKLPWFSPIYSLQILLTEAERLHPWLLYFTPGLFLCDFTSDVCSILMESISSAIVRGEVDRQSELFPRRSLARFCALTGYSIIAISTSCPFKVASARLSIQGSHPRASHGPPEKVSFDEEKIGLNHNERPYAGFVDCIQRIVKEEGYSALFRAWWFDFVSGWWWLPFAL